MAAYGFAWLSSQFKGELIIRAVALTHCQFGAHLDLLAAMFRLRRRVFNDRLNWAVSVSGDLELDVFDALNPTYLLVLSDQEQVVGCVRLLKATGPTMLAETFPTLLGGKDPPCSERILESSRFCVDTRLAAELGGSGLSRATYILFAAMIEALRAADADSIVTVTDTRMERILRRAGWPLERIASPQRIGETAAVAGFLRASDQTLRTMYRNADIQGPVLVTPISLHVAA